ncbi:hypothetical protein TNCV_5015261 [Trichonephila clavipes]|nr:hypothetical protein TNCV_5015261 [Trichonephila clavipes]
MNCRRETSENERALVIKWSKDGKSLREIASLLGKSPGVVSKKYRRRGCVANKYSRKRAQRSVECCCKEKSSVKRPETCILDISRN